MKNLKYDSTKSRVIIAPSYGMGKETVVPADLLDRIAELGLSTRDLSLAGRFHSLAKAAREIITGELKSLVGVYDNANLSYYFANWEDSEWLTLHSKFAIVGLPENVLSYEIEPSIEGLKKAGCVFDSDKISPDTRIAIVNVSGEKVCECADDFTEADGDEQGEYYGCSACQPFQDISLQGYEEVTLFLR